MNIQLEHGIELLNGSMFNFMDPDPTVLSIEEFAHVASNICRFAGHVRYFYSLAQHLVNTSLIVAPGHEKAALLHDFSEGFTNDIVTPLKHQVPTFKDIEVGIEYRANRHYGLPYPHSPEVKLADLQMLGIEKSILKPSSSHWAILDGVEWEHLVDKVIMQPLTPRQAFLLFRARWEEVR